jgi:superfamily II DNA or RNA helicase
LQLPGLNQTAIFIWGETGKGSGIIEAVAGAGKTTVLIEILKYLKGKTTLCAFALEKVKC